MLRNRVFRQRNDRKCAVHSRKDFELLILRNRDLRHGNFHIWNFATCYVVDFLILRNCVLRLRNVQVWVVLSWKVVVLHDFNEFCFQTAKSSDMDCVEVQGDLSSDFNEWYSRLRSFQIRAVPSCKKVDLIILRNSVFRTRNIEIWAVMSSNEVDLLMLRNRVFSLRIVQKYAVPSAKGVICWCTGISFSGCEKFR